MMFNGKLLLTLVVLVAWACFTLGCSDSKPSHSAGLATKEQEVASGDWKFRERNELPEYFKKHLKNKIKEVKAVYAGDNKNKEVLVFFTDYHIEENQGFSPLLVQELDKELPLSLVAFGGDIYDKGPSAEEALKKIEIFHKRFAAVGSKMYGVVGNHEYNTSLGNRKKHPEAAIGAGKLKQYLVKKSEAADAYGDYWIDIKDVRYFFLGTNPKQNLKAEQYTWFFEALEQVPKGKTVLLFSHLGCGNAEEKHTLDKAMLPVVEALGALKTGQSFLWKGRTYRYAGKQVQVVGCLSGHVHKDDMVDDNGITVVATARDALRFDSEKKQTRKPGSISEQVLEVVVLDKAQHRVDLVRVGHGKNRSFSY